ncbi:MAG: ParB N-terminal domain-containing protein [Synergistaceae bacterium]|jgi:ParB-like chromosome segregation protein Spo0J|nr:ParB N-terminal domain-containing protein [Synergistaceae bacterium]
MDGYQYLPSLSLDEYEALRESVRENGVIEPVVVDEGGAIIDGHHRAKICEELGVEYPTKAVEGKTEKEKIDLAFDLNVSRRHITPAQIRELTKQYLEEGWKQEDIAHRLRVTPGRVSQIAKEFRIKLLDQPSPKTPPEDKEKTELREQVEYYEKLAREQEKQRTAEIDARVKARVDAMREDYEKKLAALRDAGADPAEIERMAERRAAEKTAELEKARREADAERAHYEKDREKLRQARERDQKYLREELEKKSKEIDEAAKKHLDLEKLRQEYESLESKKIHLEADIAEEKFNDRVRRRVRGAHEAFIQASTVMQIIGRDIAAREDCCGLSVEELERFERETAQVGVMVNEIIPAVHSLIVRIKNGGGLRIVKGL